MSKLKLISLLILMSLLSSCESFERTKDKRLKSNAQSSTSNSQQSIVILYDNDVHCAVDGYAKLVALLDVMEFSVSALPYESGSFLQVSGMCYEVDASVPAPVVMDENHLFSYVGVGKRRISNLKILNPDTGKYDPVDLEKTYTIASLDYLISDWGCSGILRYAQKNDKYWGTDLEVMKSYLKEL